MNASRWGITVLILFPILSLSCEKRQVVVAPPSPPLAATPPPVAPPVATPAVHNNKRGRTTVVGKRPKGVVRFENHDADPIMVRLGERPRLWIPKGKNIEIVPGGTHEFADLPENAQLEIYMLEDSKYRPIVRGVVPTAPDGCVLEFR